MAGKGGAAAWELTLCLRGKQLDPAALTTLLGVTPSSTRTRGETRASKTGRTVVSKIGVWTVKVRAGSPTECVSALAGRFGGRLPDLSRVPGADDAFLDMLVLFEVGKSLGSEVLVEWAPDALRRLAESGVPLQITFGVIGP